MSAYRYGASLLVALIAASAASASNAEIATATGSLSVQRSLSIATARSIRLLNEGSASLTIEGAIHSDAPALIRVSGDPERLYRIRIPRSSRHVEKADAVGGLRIISVNAGDVSVSGLARMDHEGRDLLQISGNLRDAAGDQIAGRTPLPLSIDYE